MLWIKLVYIINCFHFICFCVSVLIHAAVVRSFVCMLFSSLLFVCFRMFSPHLFSFFAPHSKRCERRERKKQTDTVHKLWPFPRRFLRLETFFGGKCRHLFIVLILLFSSCSSSSTSSSSSSLSSTFFFLLRSIFVLFLCSLKSIFFFGYCCSGCLCIMQ